MQIIFPNVRGFMSQPPRVEYFLCVMGYGTNNASHQSTFEGPKLAKKAHKYCVHLCASGIGFTCCKLLFAGNERSHVLMCVCVFRAFRVYANSSCVFFFVWAEKDSSFLMFCKENAKTTESPSAETKSEKLCAIFLLLHFFYIFHFFVGAAVNERHSPICFIMAETEIYRVWFLSFLFELYFERCQNNYIFFPYMSLRPTEHKMRAWKQEYVCIDASKTEAVHRNDSSNGYGIMHVRKFCTNYKPRKGNRLLSMHYSCSFSLFRISGNIPSRKGWRCHSIHIAFSLFVFLLLSLRFISFVCGLPLLSTHALRLDVSANTCTIAKMNTT